MKIGIISDTHGVVPAWHKAMGIFAGADLILHAGDVLYHPPKLGAMPGYDIPGFVQLLNDCPISIVIARGNCDAEFYEEVLDMPTQSPYAVVQFAGLRIVIRHGHGLEPEDMRKLASKYHADLFITGHTHIPVISRMDSVIHVNPGSPSYPLDESKAPTVGLIADGRVQIVELDSRKEVMSMPLG